MDERIGVLGVGPPHLPFERRFTLIGSGQVGLGTVGLVIVGLASTIGLRGYVVQKKYR